MLTKRFRLNVMTVAVSLACFLVLRATAQEPTPPSSGRLIESILWTEAEEDEGPALRCSVTEEPSQNRVRSVFGGPIFECVLTVTAEGQGDGGKPLFQMRTLDQFAQFIPLEDGNLLTVWVGGSALHFIVLTHSKDSVCIALEAGSRTMPEIAHPGIRAGSSLFALTAADWAPAIILADWCWVTPKKGKEELHPCTANVYLWDEKLKAYRMESRRWEDRFRWPYSKAKAVQVQHVFER